MTATGFLEHVAFRVRDPAPHVAFFGAVLGLEVREIAGPADAPDQVWLEGGLQLVRDPEPGEMGRLLHLGLMVEDLHATIAAARAHGAQQLARGSNWLSLPDGLVLELIEAASGSVARMRAVRPRGNE
ncbi:VOC family protein [Paracoccus sp. (in: a-proteobacteria)]|uniref:VOC family protein n=1 Tax=Paracoccus sp. TaxID=267 RepID=UPI00321FC562